MNPTLSPTLAPTLSPTLTPTVSPTEPPTIDIQIAVQDGIQMEMRGIDSMNANEVFEFEKQTGEYYAYYHNDFVDDDAVFGFEAVVTVTNRESAAGTLLVTFSTRMRYFTTDLGINYQDLVTNPFQERSDRTFYVNAYLQADGEFEDLESVSSVTLSSS